MELQEGARTIELTKGKVALVDERDYARVSKYKWCIGSGSTNLYAMRTLTERGKQKTQLLHRFIMDPPDGLEVDHINGEGLDCRRANMRVCTHAENARNLGLNSRNTTGYKGVCKPTGRKKWIASIFANGKHIFLGCYDDVEEAARIYDKAAQKYFGEFARLNSTIRKGNPK